MTKEVTDASTVPPAWQQIIQSRGLILLILFLATGALGIPLLWASPAFSSTSKWFWSVIVTIYTIALIGITVAIVWWSYVRITETLR